MQLFINLTEEHITQIINNEQTTKNKRNNKRQRQSKNMTNVPSKNTLYVIVTDQ